MLTVFIRLRRTMLCKSFQALTRPVSAHVAIDLFFQTAIFPPFVIVESGVVGGDDLGGKIHGHGVCDEDR